MPLFESRLFCERANSAVQFTKLGAAQLPKTRHEVARNSPGNNLLEHRFRRNCFAGSTERRCLNPSRRRSERHGLHPDAALTSRPVARSAVLTVKLTARAALVRSSRR